MFPTCCLVLGSQITLSSVTAVTKCDVCWKVEVCCALIAKDLVQREKITSKHAWSLNLLRQSVLPDYTSHSKMHRFKHAAICSMIEHTPCQPALILKKHSWSVGAGHSLAFVERQMSFTFDLRPYKTLCAFSSAHSANRSLILSSALVRVAWTTQHTWVKHIQHSMPHIPLDL